MKFVQCVLPMPLPGAAMKSACTAASCAQADADHGQAGRHHEALLRPETITSTPHSSMRKSIEATELAPSTNSGTG